MSDKRGTRERNMDELLAWYANGTLAETERREVETWLDDNPEARSALAELQFIQQSVSEEGAEEPVFNTEAGFDKLMARVELEQPVSPPARQINRSLFERLQRWIADSLQWHSTPAFARVAMVSQFGVVLALGVVLLLPGETEQGFEVLSGAPVSAVVSGLQADIGVRPETDMAQFQALLREQGAMIVAGPSGLGIYRIQLPADGQTVARLAALKAHPAVIYLQRVAP